jgi:hypothetical protein
LHESKHFVHVPCAEGQSRSDWRHVLIR